MSDVISVELRDFAPLRDFGGYGIRPDQEMKAGYLRGGTGVLLTTVNAKHHLIGSDTPERLVEVLAAITHRE